VASGRRYYRGITGSAALFTAPLEAEGGAAQAERLAPGEMRRVPLAGELIGAARVRAGCAALPLEAFDRTGGLLAAEEQAAYLQLLRLAYGEGRNFCRAGKRDLMARLGLSERRLNRVLGALVDKRFLRPLHRDNRGTLWRVYLPREAFGEPVGDDVLLGKAAAEAEATPPRPSLAPAVASLSATGLRSMARELALARGATATPEVLAGAAAEIRQLLDDGHSRRQVDAGIRAVARRGGREADARKGAVS
jgi:hypothetical protein